MSCQQKTFRVFETLKVWRRKDLLVTIFDKRSGATVEQKPLLIEIVAYAPTAYYHCTHCEVVWQETGFSRNLHREQVAAALPDDMARQYQAVSDWVRQLFRAHGGRVLVKVVDAASLEGFALTLRHGLRRYPAVVVGGQAKYAGTDFAPVEAEIARRLGQPQPA